MTQIDHDHLRVLTEQLADDLELHTGHDIRLVVVAVDMQAANTVEDPRMFVAGARVNLVDTRHITARALALIDADRAGQGAATTIRH